MPHGDYKEIVPFPLSQTEKLQGYFKARPDPAREIATVSMNETDEGMNLAIYDTEGILLTDHQMGFLRASY
jgi:hypothetical protein